MSGPSQDLYFSCDVETDGPIPGSYSLVSLGLCLAGSFDGRRFTALSPDADTFYRELKPISERWDAAAPAVSGLTREHLLDRGAEPAEAMRECAAWVKGVAAGSRPVLVCYPLTFDASFLHWYFVEFNGGVDPFGFSSHLDMKTMYQTKARSLISRSTRSSMPPHLLESPYPHTHNALDDAKGQAVLFQNLFEWDGRR
jgi:DNA polymerase III epsilon subunit-like protein